VTAHTDWCEQKHARDGLKRCSKWIGRVDRIHVYVSGVVDGPPQVLVDGNGALSRLSVDDALVLHELIGRVFRVARSEVEP
jgi:hypothetical protein